MLLILFSIRTRRVVSLQILWPSQFTQTWPKRCRVRRHFDEVSCRYPRTLYHCELAQLLNLAKKNYQPNNQHFWANALVRIPINICGFNCIDSTVKVITKVIDFTNTGNATHHAAGLSGKKSACLQRIFTMAIITADAVAPCTAKPLAATVLIIQHIEAEPKSPTYPRRHFQMHFLEWKCVNFH